MNVPHHHRFCVCRISNGTDFYDSDSVVNTAVAEAAQSASSEPTVTSSTEFSSMPTVEAQVFPLTQRVVREAIKTTI